jgi:hypothetical protein
MQQKKYVPGMCAGLVALLLAGCGSSSSPNGTPSPTPTPTPSGPVTGLKKRVLISIISSAGLSSSCGSVAAGCVVMVDGQKNVFAKTIGNTDPAKMVTAGGQTLIMNSTVSQVSVFDNTTEQVTFNSTLQGQPFDIAISPDGKTGYAAIKDVGVVEVVNTSNGNVVATMMVPTAARLVEGPKGQKLLAFSDDPQALVGGNANAFFVIDTATNTATPIVLPVGSQPFTAVFDPSDTNDTTAFILNCGAECDGNSGSPSFTPTVPSVMKVTFSSPSTPVFSAPIPVSGATVGLLNGSNLFVAGTPTTPPLGCTLAACGTLQVINTGALTAGAPINVTDGLHGVMALTSNNRLYIGAIGCTVGPASPQNTVQGCLSIFDTTSGTTPTAPSESSFRQNFDVTGLQPISSSNVIYVVQGGELDIFDINTSLPSATIQQLDVSGRAMDALQIDP